MNEEVVKETAEDSVTEDIETTDDVEETEADENGADADEESSADEDEAEDDEGDTDDADDYDEDNPFGYEEFEYDENGNIIIPEDSTTGTEKESPKPEEGKKTDAEDLETKLAASEKRAKELEAHVKKLLKGYGVEADTIEEGLIKLAAESEGSTVEEYTRKHKAEIEAQELMLKTDLEALHAAFPETKQYKSILEIPNIARFGELRDKGLSVKEAYSAANSDFVRSSAAKAAKKSSSGKEHLRSVTGKGVTGKSDIVIPGREMARLRELFPGKSDAEIRKLYKATM